MSLCCKVLEVLKGKTLATAESCTGGGIGAALTAVPGSSSVYKGGVISYVNSIKAGLLGVDSDTLERCGAVSAPVAEAMAIGARQLLAADAAVSVTGLAGPDGDEYGNEIGTVYIGYSDCNNASVREFHFSGDREAVRNAAIRAALMIVLEMNGDIDHAKN